MTAEELSKLPADGFRYELVEGELRQMSPAGHDHGRIAMELAAPLGSFVKGKGLGRVYAAETGFKLKSNPDTVRAPDIAFVRLERVREAGRSQGFWQGAPDLAVEVVSPSETFAEVEEKVQSWLMAGTRLVWVVSPKLFTVTVYRSLSGPVTLTERDTLDGEDVVPGFRYPIAELFVV
jgi:Uma2 family endonuclease